MIGDEEIIQAVVTGLVSRGMPSPQRNCRISVQWDKPRVGVAVSFPTLAIYYAGSSDGGVFMDRPLIPMVAVTHDDAEHAINADLMDWAHRLVPREVLWRMRYNLAEQCERIPEKAFLLRWPRGWPLVEPPAEAFMPVSG